MKLVHHHNYYLVTNVVHLALFVNKQVDLMHFTCFLSTQYDVNLG